MRTIIITDKNDVNCGKEFPGWLAFYDVYYRGGTGLPIEDLYFVTIDGQEHRYLSSQIDVKHYQAQELKDEIERLGANIGDKVRIIKTGSGGWCPSFMKEEFHIITDIKSSGDVVFDNGAVYMFRPIVEKLEDRFEAWLKNQDRSNIDKATLREIYDAMDDCDK